MRDDDLRHTLTFQFCHCLKQPLCRHDRKVRRRLVKNHNAWIEGNRARNRDRLLAAAREALHLLENGVYIHFQALEHIIGFAIHAFAINKEAIFFGPAPKKDILPDVEISAECEILINHLDAMIAAFLRAFEMGQPAIHKDIAAIALISACHRFHQR